MFPNNNDPFPGSAAGDIGAIRIAFIMMYAGVKDVRILTEAFSRGLMKVLKFQQKMYLNNL
jgi:hypothetical protein